MAGYVAISRSLWSDPDFDDGPMSQREAWIWLIAEAAWKPHKVRRNNAIIELQRGQVAHSIRFIAEAWGWHRARVERFLKALKNRDMIETATETSVSVITICNYDKYQAGEKAAETPVSEKRDTTETNYKKDNHKNQTDTNVSVRGESPDQVYEAVEIYHEVCVPAGLSRVQKLTGKRQAAIRRRLYDCGGLDGWRAACQRVADSPFLLGDNDRGWKADLDFLATESKFTKLMEGGYDRTDTPNRAKPAQPADRHLAAAASRRDAWLDVIDEIEGQGASGDNWKPASPASPARLSGPRGGYDGSG